MGKGTSGPAQCSPDLRYSWDWQSGGLPDFLPVSFSITKPRYERGARTKLRQKRVARVGGYSAEFTTRGFKSQFFRKDVLRRQVYFLGRAESEKDVALVVISKKSVRPTGPIQFVDKLLKTWRLTAEDAVWLLGRDQDYVRKLLRGTARLAGRDIKDRIAYLFRIRQTLSSLFRDEDTENAWLREPHELLNGKAPLQLLQEGSMEGMLTVKEYVDAAAGR